MIEARFYETYYFCNIINNVLSNQFSYLGKLDEFYGNGHVFSLIQPFNRYSAFHNFIEFIVDEVYTEMMSESQLENRKKRYLDFKDIPAALDDMKPTKLPIEEAFDFYEIGYFTFFEYLDELGENFLTCDIDHVHEYMNEVSMSDEYHKLINQTTKEIFHILFQNRTLMLEFNEMMSGILELEKDIEPPEEDSSLLKDNNKLLRQNIPRWVERAVFYRDRGRCVLCDTDLSGLLNLENKVNYDHMVPLNRYGFNDISNIQLLCFKCNQDKKANPAITSNLYQSWYSYKS